MHPSIFFAVLGAVSGTAATLLFFYLPEEWRFELFSWLELYPASVTPGLVFGASVGFALYRRGQLAAWSYAAYIAASTLSYLAAVTLAIQVLVEALEGLVAIGLAAGLFGSACLTALSALLMPVVRRAKSCLLMLLSGCLLGGLLIITEQRDTLITWIAFFAIWQAGYAAALATALPQGKE